MAIQHDVDLRHMAYILTWMKMLAIIIFGFINSVLSVIFVIELVISEQGIQSPAYIPLGVDIPWEWEGKVVDPCSISIAEPGCSYDLAMTALSSQLITYTPYTVGEQFVHLTFGDRC